MKASQSNLDKLVPIGDITLSKTDDGLLTMTCPEDKGMAIYPEPIRIPLKMDLIAKTDSTDIRLKYGKGEVIFNWECNMEELHIHDPLLGNPYGVIGKGLLPINEWVHISWMIDDNYMLLLVDGEVRLFSENEPYIKLIRDGVTNLPACTVGVASAMGSTVTVKEFNVTEWIHDDQKPIALLITDRGRRKRTSGVGPKESIIKMNPGDSYTLEYSIFPKSAQNCSIKWNTNTDILKITDDTDGILSFAALEQGTAIIKGEIENENISAIYSIKSFYPDFKTNLEQLKPVSGEWTVENGLLGDGWDNCFMLSSNEVDDFTYEADLCIENGAAAALVFRAAPGAENFYCASVFPGGLIKLWNPHKVIAEKNIDIQKHTIYHLKVVVSGDHIKIYLDGEIVIDVRDSSYTNGYLGLNVFFGTSLFQNVNYKKV